MSVDILYRLLNSCMLGSLAWFRLFVGDLSNDVSDDVLSNAFNKYTSFTKARVIRDRLSGKVSILAVCRPTCVLHLPRPSTALLRSPIRRTSSRHGRKWMVSAILPFVMSFIDLLYDR